ncbi:PLP-dependent aminotransferase family protein [Pseudoalteromonas sp. T1lg65]|uniref:aminotransferase-like domain-containing protein n=1 Tax=Pseudoalteromonas sp. T1lg65 TaxID=2077101 RepID=UPI003F7A1A79
MAKKYVELAKKVKCQIIKGSFQFGDKLPSLRLQANTHRVSIDTVQAAYAMLEEQGVIASKPGSGYFVDYIPELESTELIQSPTKVSLQHAVLKVLSHCTQSRCSLGIAELDSALLPTAQIAKLMKRHIRYSLPELLKTEFSEGEPSLRAAIAKYAIQRGIQCMPEQVTVTAGAQDAVLLALKAIAKPGATILVQSPCFPGILQLIQSLDMRVIEVENDDVGHTFVAALRQVLMTVKVDALVLVPTLNNPDGTTFNLAQRKAIVDICTTHNVPIIENDIFGDLHDVKTRLPTLMSLDQSGQVIYVNSVSKSLGSGFRIGWLITQKYHQQIKILKAFSNVSENRLNQRTVADLLSSGYYQRHLTNLKQALGQQRNLYLSAIAKYFPQQVRVSDPQGGYILWLALPTNIDSEALLERVVANSVCFFPGTLFASDLSYKHFIRINMGAPFDAAIEAKLKLLGHEIKALS